MLSIFSCFTKRWDNFTSNAVNDKICIIKRRFILELKLSTVNAIIVSLSIVLSTLNDVLSLSVVLSLEVATHVISYPLILVC